MKQKIRKVIIPVAGYGTRFLPVTKAMPKEMLPIIDKPVIQYVVEEAVAAGIEDVILVTSWAKRSVEDHFDDNSELEAWLKKKGKKEALEDVRDIGKLANFIYIRQKGPYGTATPLKNARHLIGDEPFAILNGDELFVGKVPRLKQMIQVYEKYGDPVLGVIPVDDEGTSRYGIIEPDHVCEKNVVKVKRIVEKPGPKRAPSKLAAIGAYILTPDIFPKLDTLKIGQGGEYLLVDALSALMKDRPFYARVLDGVYHDTGSKLGWLMANVDTALRRPDLKKDARRMLKGLVK
ncbi:MAG: UTP--glucose-1-phosphate uridylyltransferase [bacterium]|nr:UTP--glucose-1-phosphate uridylyltransferase [bacterium]